MAATAGLDLASFRDALRKGMGRAVVHLRRGGDPGPLRPALLDAFARNLAYDPQCEGTGTQYLFDLADAASMKDELRQVALASLPACNERWDSDHLAALALAFASEGDQAAALALRRAFDDCSPEAEVFDGLAWAVLQLDGLEGFFRAARRLGEGPPSDGRASSGSYLKSVAANELGAELVEKALADACSREPAVASFARSVASLEARWGAARPGPGEATLASLLDEARPGGGKPAKTRLGPAWARKATEAEREKAALLLAGAHEPWLQELLLGVFVRQVFPHGNSVLLSLSRSPAPRVRSGAIRALVRVGGDEVRAFALEQIGADPPSHDAFSLFASSYRQGDGVAIGRALERLSLADADELHAAGLGVVDALTGEGRGEDAVGPLGWVYEKTPCSCCRGYAASALFERGALGEARTDECRWDRNDDTRELVAGEAGGSSR